MVGGRGRSGHCPRGGDAFEPCAGGEGKRRGKEGREGTDRQTDSQITNYWETSTFSGGEEPVGMVGEGKHNHRS